jgi:hypothetical protein
VSAHQYAFTDWNCSRQKIESALTRIMRSPAIRLRRDAGVGRQQSAAYRRWWWGGATTAETDLPGLQLQFAPIAHDGDSRGNRCQAHGGAAHSAHGEGTPYAQTVGNLRKCLDAHNSK